MKISKTSVSDSEIASFIDLELPSFLTTSQKLQVKNEVGELLLDYILEKVGNAKNPFDGSSFQALSKEYKKQKIEDGAGGKPNLENTGDMLDALKYRATDEGVKIYVSGDQAGKADGHNNFSGDSTLPQRQFLPKEGDTFPRSVTDAVDAIIAEYVVDGSDLRKAEINLIDSKSALNAFLKMKFPDVSVREAKSTILLDTTLRVLFADVLGYF